MQTEQSRKRVFVTGANGFVGRHFCNLIAASVPEWHVVAAPDDFELRDAERVLATLRADTVPDAVLHLAAQSSVPQAFADPKATFEANFMGTLHLLQALKSCGFSGRFIYVGTADAYGHVPEQELPVSENRPLRPRNPYAVSKAAAEALVYQWSQSETLNAVMVRPFNHIGPGQDERFAVAAFARQAAEIALGRRPPRIDVGDIEVTRDFTDVRDVVRAYADLLTRGQAGSVYNIGSGVETRLAEILDQLIAFAGVRTEIATDRLRLRPAEQRRMVADATSVKHAIGWQPRYALKQTLEDIYTDWKERLAND